MGALVRVPLRSDPAFVRFKPSSGRSNGLIGGLLQVPPAVKAPAG